ncbi:AAA family ATPase [Streptomyces melanosporofaciens]|uniref:WD40 repeat n=1 Tax=Streptomyces melanosporofaciens TaxID=67327 RepID=A0A1H4KQ62_STRMJ|nr:AAA family ATPase [Streptomyces melanosporofaciens]SEB60647.1 WD40 repeat [Streptomyces melanosporofaciens]
MVPEGEVLITFPYADQPDVVARPAHRLPEATVLRLAEPVECVPAPLAAPDAVLDHTLRVEATVPGTPVFDLDADAVVGVVAPGAGLPMLPIAALLEHWPWLRERMGWRLDLDPSLRTHWLPRARGSEVESDSGAWYFTGRVAARRAVCDWLTGAEPLLLVTGGPGTGKSAVLAHLLVAADPVWEARMRPSQAGPRPPVGAFDAALHVKGRTRSEVVERLAMLAGVTAADQEELVVALRERRQATGRAFVVLADAVEEAAGLEEAHRIARLLWELACTGSTRVVAGVRSAPPGTARARVLAAFGRSVRTVDLDAEPYRHPDDVTAYVLRRLEGEDADGRYRGLPRERLRALAAAIATKARGNFLIAQVTSRWLLLPTTPPVTDPALDGVLPETIGEAMEKYLDAFGQEKPFVQRLLTALAYARGDGLPRDDTWLAVADALHPGHAPTTAELTRVFHSAANYLVERATGPDGEPAYRLYHEALDEHLRSRCDERHPDRAIADALYDRVPVAGGWRRWEQAAPYTRAHLAEHAAVAGELDRLLTDAGFLLHADPSPLLALLSAARTEPGRLAAVCYRASSSRHRHADHQTRCRILALDAARFGAHDLHDWFNALTTGWPVRFATGTQIHPANIATLDGHKGALNEVVAGTVDGRAIAVSGSYHGTIRVWDLAEQRPIGPTIRAVPRGKYRRGVTALALGTLDGRPIVLTGGDDCLLRMWDLWEQRQIDEPLTGHITKVRSVAVTDLDGRPIAVSVGDDTVRIWDLRTQRQDGESLPAQTASAVTVTKLDGRGAIVVGTMLEKTVDVWDLRERRRIRTISTPESVNSLAVTMLDGAPTALTGTGGDDGTVRGWNLDTGAEFGPPLVGHSWCISGISVIERDGRPIMVTSAGNDHDGPSRTDNTIRVWDLRHWRPTGDTLTGHTSETMGIATATVEGNPVAVSVGGWDGTVRLWDLAESTHRRIGDPLTGHSRSVTEVAVLERAGQRIAVTGALDDTVYAWDLRTERPIPQSFPFGTYISALALAEVRGQPLTVVCGIGALTAWSPGSGHSTALALPFEYAYGYGTAAAVAHRGDRPMVVVATRDHQLCFWDLATGKSAGAPMRLEASMKQLALFRLQGRLHAAVTSQEPFDETATVWIVDLAGRRVVAKRESATTAVVAACDVEDRPVVITTGQTTLHVWDPVDRAVVSTLATGALTTNSVVTGMYDGRRMLIAAGDDQRLRTWELTTGRLVDELHLPGTCRNIALGEQGTLVAAVEDDVMAFDTGICATPVEFD